MTTFGLYAVFIGSMATLYLLYIYFFLYSVLSLNNKYTILYYTTLHYTTLHYTTLHYTTLHYTTLHYTTLHYTTLHYTTLHYTILYYTILYYTILYYTSWPPNHRHHGASKEDAHHSAGLTKSSTTPSCP